MKHDIKSRVVIGDKAKCARSYFKGNTFSRAHFYAFFNKREMR